MNETVFPIIKWTGSKKDFWKRMNSLLPEVPLYLDCFLGSASIIPHLPIGSKFIGSDTNEHLINLWNIIKNSPEKISERYLFHHENLLKSGQDYYYEVRASFNATKDPLDFFFLTRTSVNGLVRFNSKGEFNVSFHHSRLGAKPSKIDESLKEWNDFLKNINCSFLVRDYHNVVKDIEKDAFLFLDPPYIRSNGNVYGDIFNHEDFLSFSQNLSCNVMITLDVDEISGYKKITQESLQTHAFSKMNGNNTQKVSEQVFINYGEKDGK